MCPSTCFSRTNCSLSRYNAKGKLDCSLQDGGFSQVIHSNVYKRKQSQSMFLGKQSAPLWGIFNNYNEKLRVLRVQTAALIESLSLVSIKPITTTTTTNFKSKQND